MTRQRMDGLTFLLLGSAVFVLVGVALASSYFAQISGVDFKALYYPTRCLIQHGDPYAQSEVLRIYRQAGGGSPAVPAWAHQVATQCPYPPTIFTFTAPLAVLPWGSAHILWMVLTIVSLILASILIWDLGADYAPILSGVLIGILLANSYMLVGTGNAAGIVVSLSAVAVWCFLRERFVPAGILCLAIGLAFKPHDAGLVWLYFLLAGGIYRKRALQTLLVTVALSLPGVLWVWHVSPHWMQEMHSNILAYSLHGGINDPSPVSIAAHGGDLTISLQAVFSVFRDDPRFYNSVSYLICALLLLIWTIKTLRSHFNQESAGLALAAVSALTMLPVYHRPFDARLLLLAIPACAMFWSQREIPGRRIIGWLALVINTLGCVFISDIPLVILDLLTKSLRISTNGLIGSLLIVLLQRPAQIILLVTACFYLWMYVRDSQDKATQNYGKPQKTLQTPANA